MTPSPMHNPIGRALAAPLHERLQRVSQDFADQALLDQQLPPEQGPGNASSP